MTPSESGGSGGTRLTLSKRYSAASSSDGQAASATDSLRESREHDEVGVEPHPLDAADAEERKAVVVLQSAEFALNGRAAAVEVSPFWRAALDRRLGLDATLPEWDYGRDVACAAFVVDPAVVERDTDNPPA
jgi:hypothetical protein